MNEIHVFVKGLCAAAGLRFYEASARPPSVRNVFREEKLRTRGEEKPGQEGSAEESVQFHQENS